MTTEEERLIKLEKDVETIAKAVRFLLEVYLVKPEQATARGNTK